jgi:hypothetical protein
MSDILLKCLFALFSLFGPFLLYYSLTAKILIDKQCIVKKSVFGAKKLNFNKVKSFGVYLQEGKSIGSIERSEYDNTFWFAIKFIFVANRNDYSPNSFRQKGSIRFHYTKELYEAIGKLHQSTPHGQKQQTIAAHFGLGIDWANKHIRIGKKLHPKFFGLQNNAGKKTKTTKAKGKRK